uniref:Uncharacterized protein n=1 Tax=Lygus hesperus TaxID=30085 RepID=A0A146LLI2_LYGHE
MYSTNADTFIDTDLPKPGVSDPLSDLIQQLAPTFFPSKPMDNVTSIINEPASLLSPMFPPPTAPLVTNTATTAVSNTSTSQGVGSASNAANSGQVLHPPIQLPGQQLTGSQINPLQTQTIPQPQNSIPFSMIPLNNRARGVSNTTRLSKSSMHIEILPLSINSIDVTVQLQQHSAEWCDFLYRMVDQSISQNMFTSL